MIAYALAALAADTAVFEPRPLAGRPVLDLRVGVVRTDPTSHPYICAEGAVLPWLSLEGCGTGSGFLHRDAEPDLAHFRARARPLHVARGRFDVDGLVGVGFAEVQRSADAVGFRFGAARDDDQVEGAGPEASIGAKGRLWVDPRAYIAVDVTGGAAYVPAAPVVIGQEGPWVGFGALSVGLGF